MPSGLTGFDAPMVGRDGYTLPATQHDVVVWLAGAAYDVVFDLSRGIVASLASRRPWRTRPSAGRTTATWT